MPVEPRVPGNGRGALVAPPKKPQFHLRLPDVFVDRHGDRTLADGTRRANSPPVHDAVASARAKLSEKRFAEGHQQMAQMIATLRHRRQRFFRGLWSASVLLTALSVVALAVELLQRMDVLNPLGDPVRRREPEERWPGAEAPRGDPFEEARGESRRSPRMVEPAPGRQLRAIGGL